MKKLFPVLMVLAFFLAACGGGSAAEPTSIPIDATVPTEDVAESNEAGESVDEDTEAGTERVTPADGMVQVFIPEGRFLMGGIDANSSDNEKPEHKITVSSFWLDQLEVTNGMYALCVDAGACEQPISTASEKHDPYFYSGEFVDFPVIYVTWNYANDYCTWAGKRLPTEAEWEYAARGDGDYRSFPWGDERPNSTHANFNNELRDVARVGSYAAGASPFGVLDMSGNVWEWVSDFYGASYYSSSPDTNPMGPLEAVGNGFLHTIRGGSYLDVEKDIRVSKRGWASGPNLDANDRTSVAYLGESSARIGFRCASGN